MDTQQIDINEMTQKVGKSFSTAFRDTQKELKIYDKTFEEWNKYFTVPINDPHNANHLRVVLATLADRSYECSDIISALKSAIFRLDFEDFLTASESRRLSKTLRRGPTETERQQKRDTNFVNSVQRLSNVYIKPFEEQSKKLKDKRESVKSLLMSVGNERNNLRNHGPTEE